MPLHGFAKLLHVPADAGSEQRQSSFWLCMALALIPAQAAIRGRRATFAAFAPRNDEALS
jgi:hypothetical protein